MLIFLGRKVLVVPSTLEEISLQRDEIEMITGDDAPDRET